MDSYLYLLSAENFHGKRERITENIFADSLEEAENKAKDSANLCFKSEDGYKDIKIELIKED